MKVRELVDKLGLKVLSGENGLDREIDGCYVSDLLSDVMGNADAGTEAMFPTDSLLLPLTALNVYSPAAVTI